MRTSLTLAAAATLAATAATYGPSQAQAADTSPATEALAAVKSHAATTHAGAGQAFTAAGTIVDEDGSSHVRLHRTYRGLSVVGGDMVVHQSRAGAWRGSSQTLKRDLTLSATPSVTKASAQDRAAAPSAVTAKIRKLDVTGSTLVVDATGASPRLAWKVLSGGTRADGTPSRLASYVDAKSGRVIRTEDEIVNVDGSGNTLYSGKVPLNVTKSGSTYQLKNAGVRGNTYTTDFANGTDSFGCQVLGRGCKTGTVITSSSTTFGSGVSSNRASAGADAQYGSNQTWDYYQKTFGRNGIFNTGKGSYNRVHYGKNYVNAFWDGTRMTYGDGDGTNYGPLVSLDVAGHEMTHGVTENSAALTYSGEPGGLNEATSDIFGTMVEFYANNANDPGDYLIGEEFDRKLHTGFRRMDNPSSDGDSLNCYSATAGTADVHYSSGIGNHFFYLLAEGSGAKTINGIAHNSPTCNGSTVTGVGRAAAAAIWYRALTVYMTSNTNYAGARTATLNAARDLYGAGSTQSARVASAWSAVSVG